MHVAHRMLTKPCDPETLKATVTSTCSLQNLLTDQAILQIVTRQATIPGMPSLYQEVLAELDASEPSLTRVSAIIQKDMAMTAKILHVANAAFYNFREEISDPCQAVTLLGLETLRSLVLAIGVFSSFTASASTQFRIDQLWKESQRSSTGEINRQVASVPISACWNMPRWPACCVILANLSSGMPCRLSTPRQKRRLRPRVVGSVKSRNPCSAGTAEVGACLLQLWGLPPAVVEAVAWHTAPSQCKVSGFSAADRRTRSSSFPEQQRNGRL